MSSPDSPRPIDILVAGGGIAGVFAALAAAEPDIRVVLVEPSNVLGGQGTGGGVAGLCGDTARVNAPFAELIATLQAHGLIAPYEPLADRRPYDLENCAFFLQEMAVARGIELLFHARALKAVAQQGRIAAVEVCCSSDLIEYRPKMVIDATGDCAVARASGLQTLHAGANQQLPMSLYFTLWDSGQKVTPFLPAGCPSWDRDDDLPMTTLHGFPTGKVEVKMKLVGFDAADGESLSRAEIQARRQMMGLIHHLQTKGYQGRILDRHVLSSVSRHLGQREGRRIVGEHLLTEEEITHACVFVDAVAVGTYHLDFHWPDILQRAGTGITTMVTPYHIPLRSLIPKGAGNLLVPGRAASGDQRAMSSFRVMATCAQTGFAAGKAALVCLRQGRDLTDPPVAAIQHAIRDGGQSLDLSDYGEYLRQRMLVREPIFEKGHFQQCHASSLVQLTNGKFLAVWFGGSREGHADVGIWLAERFQGRWSIPRQVAKVRDCAHWNPVLFCGPEGGVRLFFKVGERIAEWETWTMVSEDGGWSWSEPRELVAGDRGGRGPVKNKPIRLADGAILAGASLEKEGSWNVFVDRSDDGGEHWQASEVLELDRTGFTGAGVIQPALWESAPGQVHMVMRSTCGKLCRSDSQDGGRTWSPIYQTALPNNNSGLDLARLDDGALALVCNPVVERVRTPLSVLLSFDNGHSWPRRLELESEEGEYSYPAIVPTRVGMAITYTWRRTRIAFWMGSVEQVPPRDG